MGFFCMYFAVAFSLYPGQISYGCCESGYTYPNRPIERGFSWAYKKGVEWAYKRKKKAFQNEL